MSEKLFGDWFAEITKKVGIKSCIPCQARQQKMNDLHTNVRTKLAKLLGK